MQFQKPRIEVLGQQWEPVMIQPDSETLAEKGERVMLRFSFHREPEFFIAPRSVIYAGWVVGVRL